jgi:AraC-like DNA-binding protein
MAARAIGPPHNQLGKVAMNLMSAPLVIDRDLPRYQPDDALAGVLDMFDPGLVIANRCDPATIDRLLDQADDDVVILAILSQPRDNQLILALASVAEANERVAEFVSRGVVLCAASRTWLEEECGDDLATDGELLLASACYFLDMDTTRLAHDVMRSPMKGRVGALYLNAKCRELICSAMYQLFSGNLVPVGSDALSVEDTRRLIEARRLIATNFSKKLTLGSIAKACGLNRTNLARGFRELFDCSIAEALAEKRLNWASTELAAGGMSISQIAYSAGYLSHASFSRAFAKHFGVSPKQWRRLEIGDGSQRSAC